jgi:hypothetical protein
MSHTVADKYRTFVNARDVDSLAALFTESAAVRFRKENQGPEAIRAFYTNQVFESGIKLRTLAVFQHDNVCVGIFDGDVPTMDRPLHLVDVFTLDDEGKVLDLEIFSR